jgi:hypothetical protein
MTHIRLRRYRNSTKGLFQENLAMVTQNQIDSFHQFASKQLTGDGSDRSIDELARCSSWLAAFPRPTPPVIQFHYCSPESKVSSVNGTGF